MQKEIKVFIKRHDFAVAVETLALNNNNNTGGVVLMGIPIDPIEPQLKNSTVELNLAWKPDGPWKARRHGTENSVWFSVVNDVGEEIFCTPRCKQIDEAASLAEVFLILTSVNRTQIVALDDKLIKVEWR